MTANEIIEAALGALAEIGPDQSDDRIKDAMTAAGVDADLAAEALVFLPLAFGRVAFANAGPDFPATYKAGDRERDLADHPLYLEALAAAGRCDRDVFRAVVMRSSETHALNKAAHAGSQLEDLVFAPPVFADDPGRGRAELESNVRVLLTPESRRVAAMTREIIASHGGAADVDARVYSGVARSGFVAVQLDVEVRHSRLGDRRVIESCGGAGDTTGAAVGNAVEKFCRGSLHAILGGIIDPALAGDQVEVEVEERAGWRLTLGPLLTQFKMPASFEYGPLFDALIERFLAGDPSPELHWLRVYAMRGRDGFYGHDVLLDNDEWPGGVEVITGWSWPPTDDAYAIRHLVVLEPENLIDR
jgi:hypothetical protein